MKSIMAPFYGPIPSWSSDVSGGLATRQGRVLSRIRRGLAEIHWPSDGLVLNALGRNLGEECRELLNGVLVVGVARVDGFAA
jgi:hypothetical protein